MFTSDPEMTVQRVQRLARYLDSKVMESSCLGGPFICRHASACRASVPSADFHEGQMSHVGEHYDLAEDGRPLRVVVVGQEVGTADPGIGLLRRRQQVLTVSGRRSAYTGSEGYPRRNPHMRGTTSALRLLLGTELGEGRNSEFIDLASGERVHMFDTFALVNSLLCSATKPRTKNGISSREMHENCLNHLRETLLVLEPTIVVVQGVGVWQWIQSLFKHVEPITENAGVYKFDGDDVLLAHFTHPSARNSARWADGPDDLYLKGTVVPTLGAVRNSVASRKKKAVSET